MGRRPTELLAVPAVLAALLTGCTVAGEGTPEHREDPEVLSVQATVPLPTATPYPGYEGGSAAAVTDVGAVTVLLPGSPALVVPDGPDVLLVTGNGAGVDLVRADASTGAQRGAGRVDLPGQGPVGPVALVAAPDGALWLLATRTDAVADGTATLVALDAGFAETGRVPVSTSAAPFSSFALDVDDEGTAWVVIGRRLPGTDTALLAVRPGDTQPRQVSALTAEVVDLDVAPDGERVHLLGRVERLGSDVTALDTTAGRLLGTTAVCSDDRSTLSASPDGATLVVLGDCGYGDGPQAVVLR